MSSELGNQLSSSSSCDNFPQERSINTRRSWPLARKKAVKKEREGQIDPKSQAYEGHGHGLNYIFIVGGHALQLTVFVFG
ncbi:hypothetical protein ACLKA7_010861 [Drosophila subpalustris]